MSKPIAEHITVGAFVNIRDERDALRLKVAEQARTIAELRAFIADVAEGARIRAVELAQQEATIAKLESERDHWSDVAVRSTKAEGDMLKRSQMPRCDYMNPAVHCMRLLGYGEISVAKACEWLEAFIQKGIQEPIADAPRDYPLEWDELSALDIFAEREKHFRDCDWVEGSIFRDQAATIERLKAFAERATGLLQGTRLIDSKPWADLLRAGYAVLSKQEPPA